MPRLGGGCARRCCCCAAPAAVLVAAALYAGYLLTTPPAPPAPLPAAKQAEVKAQVHDLKQKVRQIAKDAAAGKAHPFTLKMTEDELNAYMASDEQAREAMRAHRLERVWAHIENGHVLLTAVRAGTPLSVTATLVPQVRSDRSLGFTMEGMSMGRLGVPATAALKRAADRAIAQLDNHALVPRARFESVRAEDGVLTLVGNTR